MPIKTIYTTLLCLLCEAGLTEANAQTSLHFDGNDDFVQTTFTGPTGTKSRTVEAWIKTPFKKGQEVIADYGTYSTGARFTLALIDGKVRVEVYGSGVTGPTVVGDDKWHHVAVTFNNSASPKYRTYIDGKISDSFNITTAINTGSSVKFRLGVRVDNANYFEGNMDEVRVWNYARNHRQILNNYQREYCDREKGLVAYYKLNEGVVGKNNAKNETAKDYATKGNDGDLKNFGLSGTSSNWLSGLSFTRGVVNATFADTACGKYRSPSRAFVWTNSGKYYDTLENYMGCDSAVEVNLHIIQEPTKTINATSCKVYVSPSGNQAWNKSGTYTDRLNNPNGCDTIVTVNLVVSGRSFDTTSASSCTPVKSPSGKYTWSASGSYNDTLASIYGCDSIVTTHVNILTTQVSMSQKSCGSYTSPSGKHTWIQSGMYTDTLLNSNNCDSVLRIDLTILNPTTSTTNVYECASFTSPSGKYVWTKPGMYVDTIGNAAGCDSIMNINLAIGNSVSATEISNCHSITSPSGKTVWTSTGLYNDTIKTRRGCDSVLLVTATILTNSSSVQEVSACNTYTSPSGNYVFDKDGVYADTIPNSVGCDSVIIIDLDINRINASVSNTKSTITALSSGVSYQWYDCANGFIKIDGETKQTFTATQNGEYAVVVNDNTCRDTSDCVKLTKVDIFEYTEPSLSKVYPNPTSEIIRLEVAENEKPISIQLIGVDGQVVSTLNATNPEQQIAIANKGVYLLVLTYEHTIETHRVIRF